MRRVLMVLAFLLLVGQVAVPAFAWQCKLTIFAAGCQTNYPVGNAYWLHPTWTNGEGCTAHFKYEYREYPSGEWTVIAEDTAEQEYIWPAPHPGSYQFRCTILCQSPCYCNGSLTECVMLYPADSGLDCSGGQ